MEGKVTFHNIELEPLWEERQKDLEAEEASIKEFKKLDEETREALGDLVSQALEKMRENREEWLPYAISLQEGSCIDVKIRIVMSDISEEIVRRRAQERDRIALARAETADMVADLESEKEKDELGGGASKT